MLEFAVVFPLLLFLAISVADYGYYLEHVDNIAAVVRDGARFASENDAASPLPWSSGCADPTWLGSSTGGWSCAGLATSVYSLQPTQAVNGSSYTIEVNSAAGFSTELQGFNVTTTTSTGVQAIIDCTSANNSVSPPTFNGCSADSGTGNLVPGATLEGTSDFTEGVIQQEAESLTIPEGGLPVDNIDCCWKGTSGSTGSCPTSGSGSPSSTTPAWGAAVVIPTSWPTGVSAPTGSAPVSCMTISYWNSSDLSYSSLSPCGWWSSDAGGDAGAFQPTNSCEPARGELVQVTLAYAWGTSNPGPLFTILNSVFHININASATYSFVVTGSP